MGNPGQELAGQNERFRARPETIFRGRKQRFAANSQEAQQKGELAIDVDLAGIAVSILAGWEGAFLRSKAMNPLESLRN